MAGLSVLCRWVEEGFVPERDVTVVATRAEESVWFPVSYIGSRTAFDLLSEKDLQPDVPIQAEHWLNIWKSVVAGRNGPIRMS